jgi:DNA replication protein DnaC
MVIWTDLGSWNCGHSPASSRDSLITSNLPFQEWTEILGSERLTGALLDRLTHHVHILEMNGDSYRLKQSRRKRTPSSER